jgi:trigger factor
MTRESLSERYRETAEKQVKRLMILGKIINQEDLTVSDEELEKGFEEMAASFNQPVEDIKRFYQEKPDNLDYFKQTLLEKQAISLIIDNSTIEEVAPEEAAPEEATPEESADSKEDDK